METLAMKLGWNLLCSLSNDYSHPDNDTRQIADIADFKPFTKIQPFNGLLWTRLPYLKQAPGNPGLKKIFIFQVNRHQNEFDKLIADIQRRQRGKGKKTAIKTSGQYLHNLCFIVDSLFLGTLWENL